MHYYLILNRMLKDLAVFPDFTFLSPEPKARREGRKLFKLKNFLLQNHSASFNQTWHKAALGEGDSGSSKKGFGSFAGQGKIKR